MDTSIVIANHIIVYVCVHAWYCVSFLNSKLNFIFICSI